MFKVNKMGKVLYWLFLLSSFLHFSLSTIKLIFTYFNINSEIPNYIMMLKICLNYITSIIILIGITIAYFKFKNHNIFILYQKLFLYKLIIFNKKFIIKRMCPYMSINFISNRTNHIF